MTPKIGCVQHDCDKCKAQAENNAELLRTVRAQAAELEAAKANTSKWQSLCDGNIVLNERLIKQLDALQAKLSALESQEPVASIYVATDGSREFDDWRCDLPMGRTELYAAPVAPQQEPSHQFIAWCTKYFGGDADEDYLADAIKHLPKAQPVAQPAEALLLREMRYIAGISTGQVKRVAEQALANVAQQPAEAPNPKNCTNGIQRFLDMLEARDKSKNRGAKP